MSNPTPILNNINAFDATQGTTISFNIIGGTDIVRSNIVYIYDLSTNDLICTHLYISTESIHELPPNTDPSIVYASGKSSADFVNNKNYYLQIQTFTNTAGTAGGSGMSVAKTFWCLSNPSLSVNAIPAAISTTSYNVGATYNTNVTDTSIPVTNIIQQYKFDLYTATGTLVQTSGNIIGSGEQEGTSTTYNITYNFSGLVVNNSYYVVVTTTSTEGMTVSAQSNTFTVSIDTPTLGEATVVNNACDGYISVTSNLSGEYGGSASGEIASFETDSVNNVSSLKVNMEPVQDLNGYDAPWVGGAGKNILDESTFTSNGTFTESNGVFSNASTDTRSYFSAVIRGYHSDNTYENLSTIVFGATGRQVFPTFTPQADIVRTAILHSGSQLNLYCYFDCQLKSGQTYIASLNIIGFNSQTVGGLSFDKIQIEEGTTATSWTPYENICPISGHTDVGTEVCGANIWGGLKMAEDISSALNIPYDSETKTIRITTGLYQNDDSHVLSPNVKFKENTQYTLITSGTASALLNLMFRYTDGTTDRSMSRSPTIGAYVSKEGKTIGAVVYRSYSGSTILNYEECGIFEGVLTAEQYEPYQGQTYTTDLNQTVYGGTLDMATGVLTVDRAMVTYDGSETWSLNSTGGVTRFSTISKLADAKKEVGKRTSMVSDSLVYASSGNAVGSGFIYGTQSSAQFFVIVDQSITTVDAFKEWLSANPTTIVYELATPKTYQLTPHQIQTLVGQNNIWSDAGNVEVTFNLPITNLLVKRQDTSDTSGKWLTLYSQPITQASDMDFTYIDFLNQHGKTYRYALVPLLTQQQGDVDVEIEGGYTVSDDVLSVFDGVFVANSNGSQKLKAATEYGDLETNQDVGVLTTIGGKYPFVVSNSNLNYHSGSISALIVPSDFYTSGDLDRLSIVERREAIEKFLTDKTAKILKDWNGNIWLITFVENVEVSFVDDYGMGLGTLSAKWVEIGDVNDQTDLKQTGLI